MPHSVRCALFNELLRVAFELFLAAGGAEVVCFSFVIQLEFSSFFIKHGAAHIISQSIAPVFFAGVQYIFGEVQYKMRVR